MPSKRKFAAKKKDKNEKSAEDITEAAGDFSEDTTDATPKTYLESCAKKDEFDLELAGIAPSTPIPEISPEPLLLRIPLRVFEKIAGAKPDQLAGFSQYAKAGKLGPMTVPEWRGILKMYRNRPTNPLK